jgi:hypothetical protein
MMCFDYILFGEVFMLKGVLIFAIFFTPRIFMSHTTVNISSVMPLSVCV